MTPTSPSTDARKPRAAPKAKKPTKSKATKVKVAKAESKTEITERPKAPAAKPEKVRKPKLVRDSFTIPKDEYELLATLKQRCIKLERPAKKSELLRAGIKALIGMSDKALLAALLDVPALKTGRPKKG